MRQVFTTGQVAKICKVSVAAVNRWFDRGALKGYRIPASRDRRVPYESLVRFLQDQGFVPSKEAADAAILAIVPYEE